jgi:hypothetical protein
MYQLDLFKPLVSDYTIEVRRDDWRESPREDYNLGMFFTHNDKYISNEYRNGISFDDFSSMDEIEEYMQKKGFITERVCVYDHSGVSLYIGEPTCRWDSGYIGLYIADKDDVRKAFGVKRISSKLLKKVREGMKAEVETMNNWINGNVFEFSLRLGDEEVNSCSGFIADNEEEALDWMLSYMGNEFVNAPREEILKITKFDC